MVYQNLNVRVESNRWFLLMSLDMSIDPSVFVFFGNTGPIDTVSESVHDEQIRASDQCGQANRPLVLVS